MAEQARRTGSRTGRSGATKRMLVAIAALGLLLGLGAGEALGAVTWSGAWTRDEHPGETLTLTQAGPATAQGTTASGSYTWSGTGTITGGTVTVETGQRLRLRGAWNDKGGSGRFDIVMNQNLTSYDGRWGWGASETDGGRFSGSCLGGECASNAPSATFGRYPWIIDARSFRKLWVNAGRRKNAVIRALARDYRRARNSRPGSRARFRALSKMRRDIDNYSKLRRLLKKRIDGARPSTVSSCLSWARLHNKTMLRREGQLRLLHRAIAARPQTVRSVAARKRHFKEQNRLAAVNQRYSKRLLDCIKSRS